MGIQHEPKPRMPQPEQWLSEHPFVALCILLALVVGLVLVIRYA
jgi:hypothetical protein